MRWFRWREPESTLTHAAMVEVMKNLPPLPEADRMKNRPCIEKPPRSLREWMEKDDRRRRRRA